MIFWYIVTITGVAVTAFGMYLTVKGCAKKDEDMRWHGGLMIFLGCLLVVLLALLKAPASFNTVEENYGGHSKPHIEKEDKS